MSLSRAFVFLPALILLTHAVAQKRVDPHFTHYRVYCVVPLVGTGGSEDPVRPDHVPLPPEPGTASSGQAKQATGIIAFYDEISDDGKWALVEIVALDRASLAPILADNRPGVWAAEKGSVTRAELREVFGKYRKNIDLDNFGVAVQ